MKPFLFLGMLAVLSVAGQEPQPAPTPPAPIPRFVVSPDMQTAAERISADSLKGNLSFLSSDLLEGRGTPSRGLDLAAEFIASEFRKLGLEPGGDDGYFQTANFVTAKPNLDALQLQLTSGDVSITLSPSEVMVDSSQALELKDSPLFKIDTKDTAAVQKIQPEDLKGKVIILEQTRNEAMRGLFGKLRSAQPAAVLLLSRFSGTANNTRMALYDPVDQIGTSSGRFEVRGPAVAFFDALAAGNAGAKASIHLLAPRGENVKLRNVVGILRGSDPRLRETCVLVSAHYDHLGMKANGEGDRIYNGANDDGSGTVSVIEVARALAALKNRPKRSVMFVTFFGEEKGLFGSRFYALHPVFPIEKTVAQLNLEQVGRTDETSGKQEGTATLTGYGFSNVADYLQAAGDLTGIKLYDSGAKGNQYFSASDNQSLADVGVPAHTLCVAFEYPDYHGLSDTWDKIDYVNMAKVDRTVAVAVEMMADSTAVPHWREDNTEAARYQKAWRERHPVQ